MGAGRVGESWEGLTPIKIALGKTAFEKIFFNKGFLKVAK
jgi:hypothetical protein